MNKLGSDRRREANLLVRELPLRAVEVQSLGDPQATAPSVPQRYPTKWQGSSGVPPISPHPHQWSVAPRVCTPWHLRRRVAVPHKHVQELSAGVLGDGLWGYGCHWHCLPLPIILSPVIRPAPHGVSGAQQALDNIQ